MPIIILLWPLLPNYIRWSTLNHRLPPVYHLWTPSVTKLIDNKSTQFFSQQQKVWLTKTGSFGIQQCSHNGATLLLSALLPNNWYGVIFAQNISPNSTFSMLMHNVSPHTSPLHFKAYITKPSHLPPHLQKTKRPSIKYICQAGYTWSSLLEPEPASL